MISPSEKDIFIEKDHPDSFQETGFHQQFIARNINRIIITGIQSEICVDATCRRAFSEGYDIILVEDDHSTYNSNILSIPNYRPSQWNTW